jgi:hypothetical protein
MGPRRSPSSRWRRRATDRAGSIVIRGTKLYSQNAEELIVRDWFQDQREGFFVDAGAGDWRQDSTTYYLEHHLGWSGVAVDARRSVAQGFLEHRPSTRFFHYLLTDHAGTRDPFYEAGWLSSTDRDYLSQYPIDPELITETSVETITLTELLDTAGAPQIDYLSLDLELGEAAALRGFAMERFRPRLVCVEAGWSQREWLSDYFSAHGYRRLDRYLSHDHVNWWFAPIEAPPGGSRARTSKRDCGHALRHSS